MDRCIRASKNKKSTGPDQIANEHLKSSAEMLTPIWTEIFNKCISTITIPENWRKSTLKILYKGKGNTEDPHAYRGVALENTSYKIFMKIITNKLTELTDQHIPENQFGFRKAKSTLQAAEAIMKEIDEALNQPKGKYFTVFIDYEKAFDSVNRGKLMQKLGDMIGKDHHLIYIIQETMRRNILEITDGVSTSQEIIQTNGDPISPLLFNVMTSLTK